MEPDRLSILAEHVADHCCAAEADRVIWRDGGWALDGYSAEERADVCRSLGLPRVCQACRVRLAADTLAAWEREGVRVTPVRSGASLPGEGVLLVYPNGRAAMLWTSGEADTVAWRGWAAHAIVGAGASARQARLRVFDPAPRTMADLLAEHEEAGEPTDDRTDLLR